MGFSVTVANVIFAVALLTAFSHASTSYWKSQERLLEAKQTMDRRASDAVHAKIIMSGAPTYNSGSDWYRFTIENDGSVPLDWRRFSYLVDGRLNYNMSSTWPRLNGDGSATTSNLVLPGDTLQIRLENVASTPSDLVVYTEFGYAMFYP